MDAIERSAIMPGVYLTTVVTDRFKSSCLSINLLQRLDSKTASAAACVGPILRRGTRQYPDMESYAAALDTLYGAQVITTVRKKGEVQCVGLVADFVDGRYTPDGDRQLAQVLDLLCNTLLNPPTENGQFINAYFESERDNLVDRIASQINEKSSYALQSMIAHMCSGEAYGIDRLGDRDHAEALTNKALTAFWRQLLETSTIEIFYCGSSPREALAALLKNALHNLPRGVLTVTGTQLVPQARKPRTIEERLDVSQAKLALGFRTGCNASSPHYPAALMASMVFGGALTSKLFVNVREKLSLCYYASSRVDKWKGLMFVQSGIETAQYKRALDEILFQLEQCATGQITQQEHEAAYNTVASLYKAINDSPSELEDFSLGQAVAGLSGDADEIIAQCRGVTRAQIAEAARAMDLDTIYLLRGLED